MKRVVVFLSSEGCAMRECIVGILDYVRTVRRDWNVSLFPDPLGVTSTGLTPEWVRKAVEDGVDGVITGLYRETPGFRALVASGLPTVLNTFPPSWRFDRRRAITCVHNDDAAIGRMAAKYMRSKGNFASYAFLPDRRDCLWSTNRRRGFELELKKARIRPATFDHAHDKLDDWLRLLAKPAAVFAVSDNMAVSVITACQRLQLSIPSQVSVVGVDNDEVFCNSVHPTLTSIHPNHLRQGHRAAVELDRLMRTHRSGGEVYVPPIRIVERQSSRTIPPAGHLIGKGLAFIEKHFHEGISASDVALHLGVSRQLLRLRFATIHGQSVRDVILETRLQEAKKLLAQTDCSVSEVAEKTGFASPCRFSHYFRQKTGTTPLAWRKASNSTAHRQRR